MFYERSRIHESVDNDSLYKVISQNSTKKQINANYKKLMHAFGDIRYEKEVSYFFNENLTIKPMKF